jgi:putative transposase
MYSDMQCAAVTLLRKVAMARHASMKTLLMTAQLSARSASPRLMREAGIYGKQPRKFVPTTDSAHDLPVAANTLNRKFAPTSKNTVWVGDITYVRTGSCWSYLSVILDLYSRRIVGFHLSSSLATEGPLIALKQAYWSRKPGNGLLVHHDRGCQYASEAYAKQLSLMGVIPPLGN